MKITTHFFIGCKWHLLLSMPEMVISKTVNDMCIIYVYACCCKCMVKSQPTTWCTPGVLIRAKWYFFILFFCIHKAYLIFIGIWHTSTSWRVPNENNWLGDQCSFLSIPCCSCYHFLTVICSCRIRWLD